MLGKKTGTFVKIIYLYSILKVKTYTPVNMPLFLAGIVLFFLFA